MKKAELVQAILEIADGVVSDQDYTLESLEKKLVVDLEEIYDNLIVNNLVEEDEDYEDDEEESIVVDISKLSKADQRHFARTGQLSQSIINKYTRFSQEVEEDQDS